MINLKFTVDAKLLRELGERLVGRPHIALAELIKNAYDADARHVELTFAPGSIRIVDDGHGMSEETFIQRWMRIGTTAKVFDEFSPALKRPLTGSKGVGRLSVQLLASSLDLHSVGLTKPHSLLTASRPSLEPEIHAQVEWPDALKKSDLTQVAVDFEVGPAESTFAAGSRHGTAIELTGLADEWDARSFQGLAREIWALQPPFAVELDQAQAFSISLMTPFPDVKKSFDTQMTALMQIDAAQVTGQLIEPGQTGPKRAQRFLLPAQSQAVDEDGELEPTAAGSRSEAARTTEETGRKPAPPRSLLITVNLKGAPTERFVVEIPDCQIHALDFEFRVFDLKYRQSAGISVGTAREYLSHFGGIHIYDNGFRLPYYGPDVDWLKLELDHARRLSNSQLVPNDLQVRNGMQDLPSNKRVFGSAKVSTAGEQRAAISEGRRPADTLSIQITRDRLVDSLAFQQMTRAVRLSLDLYALTRAKTKARGVLRRRSGVRPDSTAAIRNASEVIESLRPSLPAQEYQTLRYSIDTVADDVSVQAREAKAYAALLGALATAGMTSLAYEHEVSKQREGIAAVARRLQRLSAQAPSRLQVPLSEQAEKLLGWKERSNRIRALFRPLLDEESRTSVAMYNARKMANEVVDTMMVLARATQVETSGVPDDLTLPAGTYAAWSAILQNLLTNAFRATLEVKPARVAIDGGTSRARGFLRVQDNGLGMDPGQADRLFLPFERGAENSEKVEALGLGGSGLGLTIVRMITDELGCTVAFADPDPGWSTAVRIEWKD